MYQEPKCPYPYCSLALEFHLGVFFFPYEYPYQRNKSYFCPTIKNDVPIPICHLLGEKLCCSCIYTKTERNRSQPFKETT